MSDVESLNQISNNTDSSNTDDGGVRVDAELFGARDPHQIERNLAEQHAEGVENGVLTQEEHGWYLDKETPGTGVRPEWLPEKFKSAADLGTAYSNLEKKFGAFTGAPDEYVFPELEEAGVDFENEPGLKKFIGFAKENNMNQETVGELLQMYAENIKDVVPQKENLQETLPDADRIINVVSDWAAESDFTDDEIDILENWMGTANSARLVNKIRAMTIQDLQPAPTSMQHVPREQSIQSLQNSVDFERYKKDESYRQEWLQKVERLVGS